jgi:hypothetical protein
MTRVSVPLSSPIAIGNVEATSLLIEPAFRVGWLRGAPPAPDWLLAAIRALLSGLEGVTAPDIEKLDTEKLFANVPTPEGQDLDKMIPWFLHIAEKASNQPAIVIDQLGIADLVKIVMVLIPGMATLPNFRVTSESGAGTSQGSSTGGPQT